MDNTGTDDQTLTYTNTDPDDNVNTLQIEGSTAFNIDDNHLGTDDQTLTEDRDINLSTNDLRVNSADGGATFTNSGNLILNDATNPIFQAEDTRNGVQTRLQSSNTVGIIGTASAHSLQIRTDNTTVGQFETSGRFRLNSYGSGAFTGTVTNILGVSSNGTILEVDALSLNTDEQDLSLSSNILSLTNDPTTVDLTPYLDNTDDQALSLSGNTLTLEDGGTVNLTPYLDNTDNQQITDFDLNATTNVLTITLEDGGTQDVDLSALDNAGSDDQALSLSGNTLTLEDGGTVNLTPYLDNTDDQQITDFDLNATTNILTLTLENGGSETVCLLYTSPSPRDRG